MDTPPGAKIINKADFQPNYLKNGVFRLADFNARKSIPCYTKISTSAQGFYDRHKDIFKQVYSKWVENPFEHWSRKLEYPFVFNCLNLDRFNGSHNLEILDAGSGLTFFPFLVAKSYPQAHVVCTDLDPELSSPIKQISKEENLIQQISFLNSDLACLTDLQANSLSHIYCISVLEHTPNPVSVLEEFARILKPGGQLILTIDISIDGKYEISKENLFEVLKTLEKYFAFSSKEIWEEVINLQTVPDLYYTTDWIRNNNPQLLPWKTPHLKTRFINAAKGQSPFKKFKSLACLGINAHRNDH
jgi:ubiquinone/menaquinone biosynthesis C-methylase UbiE